MLVTDVLPPEVIGSYYTVSRKTTTYNDGSNGGVFAGLSVCCRRKSLAMIGAAGSVQR